MGYLDPLIDLMTYEDEFVEETKTLGFMYDKETDTLYMHKGVDVQYLNRLLPKSKIIYDEYHPCKPMKFEYEEVIPPRNVEQEDVINFIAGLNHHADNIDARQIFLVKTMGFGKGEPYSRKIPALTDTSTDRFNSILPGCGYKLMGDLQVGDYVFDRHGKPTKVLEIFELGEQDIYKITFEDGRTAKCTFEHLWTVKRNDSDEWETIQTKDMLNSNDEFSIPLCEPVQYKKRPFCVCDFGKHHPIIDSSAATFVNSSPDQMQQFLIGNNFYGDSGNRIISWEKEEDELYWIHEVCLPILYAMGYSAYYDAPNKCIHYSKPDSLKITDIKLSHREKARCIKVDNDEELYLTENFIVTHNTYCAGTASCINGVKTLIIVHRDNLRSQWLKSLYNMNGLTSDYTYEITSSDELYDIAYGNIELDYDVYLMTHATFRAGVRRIKSLEKIGDITKNLGIGLKIIDEAHLEFRDTLLMDFCFNVKRNLYLTATDARSAKDENTIFRHVFSHATFYKPSALLSDSLPKKWVEYISVSVNTHVKKAVYQYRIIGGRGMNAAVYGKWVIKQDKTKQHFKCCRDILKLVYVNDPHAKVLIFMPLIELCEEAAYFFRKELNYDESFDYDLNIKTINSSNSKRENEDNKRADVIVTTIGSCGTGTDIPGITTIISCSPFVSRVTALQTFGRIRYCGKVCQYYDIFDQSVPMDFFWLKSRRKKLKSLALNVKHLDWSE